MYSRTPLTSAISVTFLVTPKYLIVYPFFPNHDLSLHIMPNYAQRFSYLLYLKLCYHNWCRPTHTHMHIHILILTHACTHMRAHTHTYTDRQTDRHTHIHTDTHTHTHTTHTQLPILIHSH